MPRSEDRPHTASGVVCSSQRCVPTWTMPFRPAPTWGPAASHRHKGRTMSKGPKRQSPRRSNRSMRLEPPVDPAAEENARSWIRAAHGEWCRRWLHRLRDCECPEGACDRRWWARQTKPPLLPHGPVPPDLGPAASLRFFRSIQPVRRRGRARVATSDTLIRVVSEIHTALCLARARVQVWDHETRRRIYRHALIGQTFAGELDRPATWTPIAGPPTLWDRYCTVHRRGVAAESRTEMCCHLLVEILDRCPTVMSLVKKEPDLHDNLLWALTRRSDVGGGRSPGSRGTRPYHGSPESLTRCLAGLVFDWSERTLRRRVLFEAGHIYFGNFDPDALVRGRGRRP